MLRLCSFVSNLYGPIVKRSGPIVPNGKKLPECEKSGVIGYASLKLGRLPIITWKYDNS